MDRELISRARAGDREAFELIVVTKGEPLFRTALAILGNEADARDGQLPRRRWLRCCGLDSHPGALALQVTMRSTLSTD